MKRQYFRATRAALLALLAALFSVPAHAQSGIYNWTGFYTGIHAGGAWGNTEGMDLYEATKQSLHGSFGGGQFGYNQQFGRAVWGAEISGSYGNIRGNGNCFTNDPFDDRCKSKQDWNLAFLTRLGYAFGDGRFLPYITGGVTFTQFSFSKHFDGDPPPDISVRHTLAGGSIGAGFQYALGGGYALGVEYSYLRFFNQDVTEFASCGCAEVGNQNLATQSVRVVLNYTFGSPQAQNQTGADNFGNSNIYDWSGFYIGAHGGGERSKNTASNFLIVDGDKGNQNLDGAFGGGQLGYNLQFGRFVLGFELSGSWKDISANDFCFALTTKTRCDVRQSWSAQYLTRFGFAFGDGRLLPYLIGGLATTHFKAHYVDNGFFGGEWAASKNMVGGVFGAGFQYAVGNGLSLGLEYLYTRYGTQDFSGNISGSPLVINEYNVFSDQSLRFVANYKLGDTGNFAHYRDTPRAYDWTGFYIGINGGGDWSKASGSDGGILVLAGLSSLTNERLQGAFGGGQFGYNHQFGRFVFGTELALSYGDVKGTSDCLPAAAVLSFESQCKIKQTWTGQYLTRLGYAIDDGRTLPYLLAGAALAKLQSDRQLIDPFTPAVASWSDSQLHLGAVFGFGVQHALQNNISIGAEYLYTYYGMEQYTSTASGAGVLPGTPAVFTQDLSSQTVRVVLNYKFGG